MRRISCVFLVLAVALAMLIPTAAAAKKVETGGPKSYWETTTFAGGTFEGTRWTGSALLLDPAALQFGTDTTGRYNGGAYRFGRFTGPVLTASFVEAIASWQANTPPGTWIEVELQAQVDGLWTKWYSMGVWLEGDTPFKRHYVSGQGDKTGAVSVDTLVLNKAATAVQSRVTLFTTDPAVTPTLRAYGVTFANGFDTAGAVPSTGLTSDLAVPMRSQMIYPNGGNTWCSPTSTSMVLAYWGNVTGNQALIQTVPTVVNGVWDYQYNGGGNWPFNTAYAASFGLVGKVARLSSLAEVEPWTAAGVPVVASIAFKKGELTGAPISSTSGHLLVIRGFDAAGNVLVNDPAAASDDAVQFTYNRLEFEHAWLDNSNGTVYLIYPAGWPAPASNGHW